MITVGIISDTHVPDRVGSIHPDILPIFEKAEVQYILHAGDISSPGVLKQLQAIAPVSAVRGNRDFFAGPLPMTEVITIHNVKIALMHGHFGWIPYLLDKRKFWKDGYQFDRYLVRLIQEAGDAQVIVFGHTHHAELRTEQNKLIFNPGSASFGHARGLCPSIGLLHISDDGAFQGEIVPLNHYKVQHHSWVQKD